MSLGIFRKVLQPLVLGEDDNSRASTTGWSILLSTRRLVKGKVGHPLTSNKPSYQNMASQMPLVLCVILCGSVEG